MPEKYYCGIKDKEMTPNQLKRCLSRSKKRCGSICPVLEEIEESQLKRTDSVITAAEVSGRKIAKRGYGGWAGVQSAADLR